MKSTRTIVGVVAAVLVAGCTNSPTAPGAVRTPAERTRMDEAVPPPPPPSEGERGGNLFGSGT